MFGITYDVTETVLQNFHFLIYFIKFNILNFIDTTFAYIFQFIGCLYKVSLPSLDCLGRMVAEQPLVGQVVNLW